MPILRHSSSLKSKAFIRAQPTKKRAVSPGERKYRENFKEYLDVKTKKEGFVQNKKKTEKEDWDNYTKKLFDSPNRRAMELTKKPPQKSQIVEFEVVKPEFEHEEILNSFNNNEKEAFIRLRDLYNSLDPVSLTLIV